MRYIFLNSICIFSVAPIEEDKNLYGVKTINSLHVELANMTIVSTPWLQGVLGMPGIFGNLPLGGMAEK